MTLRLQTLSSILLDRMKSIITFVGTYGEYYTATLLSNYKPLVGRERETTRPVADGFHNAGATQ